MHIVNSVEEQSILVKDGRMTFEGVWNNISDRFLCSILFSGVRNLYHNLVLVESENG